ncbi:MAG: peptidoglycan-binding protein [Candidatus Sungbacteria bacterium]|nr:peptidoglycan-binding protein [Candidatus Sungbacteria bacterium]
MSKTFQARLKVTAVAVVTTLSITGAFAVLPQLAKAVTIDELLAQIASLQAQIASLQGGATTGGTGTGLNLTSDLSPGSRGQGVTDLQNALKTDAAVYPEGLVTGFYGSLTQKAVERFQAKYGIASSGTPATTGYGRVGPKTRAKLNSVYGGAATTGGTTTGGTTPTVTVPAGSGLSVSAATQPAETLAPESAARLPLVKITLTASNDGDVTVKSITVKREGLANDAVFAGIILLDQDGTQIGNEKTLNSNHLASLSQSFVVSKGTSKTVTIAGNMAAALDDYSGQVAKMSVTAIDAGSSSVSGSLPITGNGMTINGSLALGSATMTRGAVDPGADAASKEVGTKGYIFSAVKLTAGSNEDMLLKSVRFDQSGSAASSDLKNVKIVVGSTEYETKTDGKKYWATLGDGISVTKGGNVEILIKGDIDSGSNRTISFDIEEAEDIVALGKLYGYYVTPVCSGTCTGTASDGGFSSNTTPFYNAYDVTVSTGTLRVEKSNVISAGNVAVDINNTNLGAFTFEVKGEDIQLSSVLVNFTFSGTGTTTDITAVQIVDENGAVVAGPKDPTSSGVTMTDSWTAPIGAHAYKIQGKLDSTFVTNDTLTVGLLASGFTAKGVITGKNITPSPASLVTANTQTVRAAALKVSVAPSPIAQTVVRGLNGFLFAKIQYDATNSGEDIRITSQAVTDTVNAATRGDEVNNCQMFDGTVALNTGSNVINPTDTTDTTNEQTYTFDNHLIVPKGTTKVVDLKCNILASAASASTHSFGIASGQDTAATGVTTGTSVSEALTTSTGQIMTIATGGSFTIAKDTSSPTERWAIAGSTDQVMTIFKLHATNEALRLEKIQLTFSSSTASTTDFTKLTLWDGAIKVGEAIFAGTSVTATSTLTGNFTIPKDGDKLLTVKADLSTVGTSQPGTAGRLIAISYDGTGSTSTDAIGQSSGSSFDTSTVSNVNGDGVRLVKSYPTLAKLAIPTQTLANGSMILYSFSVTAPTAGDVGLYKFTFNVSSTTGATTSNFYVYGYSDSAFSVQAYGNNPLNARQVDIAGENSLNGAASSTAGTLGEVEVYFDPITKTSGAPNSEAISVPAGTTRYFELRSTVTGSLSGDAISVSLLGDATYPTKSSNRDLEQANTVDLEAGDQDFIWSPNTTTTAATTSVDWANGYELPGLPSTNMEQQTISR